MWPYWLMLLVPAWAVLQPRRLKPSQAGIMWLLVGLLFALMMGLRYEVGGDWGNYIPLFRETAARSFGEVLAGSDPGYYILNWLVAHAGGSIYQVNLICAAIMMWKKTRGRKMIRRTSISFSARSNLTDSAPG